MSYVPELGGRDMTKTPSNSSYARCRSDPWSREGPQSHSSLCTPEPTFPVSTLGGALLYYSGSQVWICKTQKAGNVPLEHRSILPNRRTLGEESQCEVCNPNTGFSFPPEKTVTSPSSCSESAADPEPEASQQHLHLGIRASCFLHLGLSRRPCFPPSLSLCSRRGTQYKMWSLQPSLYLYSRDQCD